jgi:protease I
MPLPRRLEGRHIAILVEEIYEDQELWYPFFRMREAGAQVTVVGPEARTYASKHGYPARADKAAKDVNADQFDAVIIPGGYAPDHMRRHPAMVALVREAALKNKVVAAICHAGWMLASAEVLRGKTVTGFFAIKDDLVHAGATYQDAEVVVDGNIITSRQPADLPAFCQAIIGALAGEVRCPSCQMVLYSGQPWD